MEQLVTAFGSAFAAPAQTAAVLRARAGANGVTSVKTQPVDLVASVVGAQALMAALGATTLSQLTGPAPAAALAAVYCRASGAATSEVGACEQQAKDRALEISEALACDASFALPQQALSAIGTAVAWARAQGHPVLAAVTAAEDLSAGISHPAIAAAVDALATIALEE